MSAGRWVAFHVATRSQTIVEASTWYFARQLAAVVLGAAPEELVLEALPAGST